jgi:hypothetical protein
MDKIEMIDYGAVVDLIKIPENIFSENINRWNEQLDKLDVKTAKFLPKKIEYYDKSDVKSIPDIVDRKERILHLSDGTAVIHSTYRAVDETENLLNWFQENIYPYPAADYEIQRIGNGAFHLHTDGRIRTFVLSYMFELGGENVETSWWKEKNQQLIREPGMAKFNFDNMEKMKSIVFPNNAWNIVDARIFHTVYMIETTRLAFCVGFKSIQSFEHFLKYTNLNFNF